MLTTSERLIHLQMCSIFLVHMFFLHCC